MNDQPERSDDDSKTYPIVCSLCGDRDRLPFRPRKDQEVFCRECFKFKRTEVNRHRQRTSPRKQHGTRVSFAIVCANCGAEETLDYVPKGVALDEALCSECILETHGGDSRWAQIEHNKRREDQGEWEFECAECGRTDYLKSPPKPDKDYLCGRCFGDQESPNPERLAGKRQVGRAVYIRPDDDHDDPTS